MYSTAFRDQDTGLMKGDQSAAIPLAGAFTDQSEVLCSPSEYGFCPEDKAMIAQYEQGPSYIVIGSRVTDEQLMKLSQRVNTDLADLMAYRDTKR
ncbi:MAG: hypothetical protein ACOYBR_08090 [Fluviibacter sp.]